MNGSDHVLHALSTFDSTTLAAMLYSRHCVSHKADNAERFTEHTKSISNVYNLTHSSTTAGAPASGATSRRVWAALFFISRAHFEYTMKSSTWRGSRGMQQLVLDFGDVDCNFSVHLLCTPQAARCQQNFSRHSWLDMKIRA